MMRLDYAFYAISIIFFILAVISTMPLPGYPLWPSITLVLGVIFAVLGYFQTPKKKEVAVVTAPAPERQPVPPHPAEPAQAEVTAEAIEKVSERMTTAGTALTMVKGIGGKRAELLKAAGISSVEELAEASAQDLATRLKISPKFTEKWIEQAKKLVKKP